MERNIIELQYLLTLLFRTLEFLPIRIGNEKPYTVIICGLNKLISILNCLNFNITKVW